MFTEKAREAYSALTVSDSKVCTTVKAAVFQAYEFLPEAYRQRFQTWQKSRKQTHMEFARELLTHFSWWYAAKVAMYEALCDPVVLEQFKCSVPGHIATYHSEHNMKTAAEAAKLAVNMF